MGDSSSALVAGKFTANLFAKVEGQVFAIVWCSVDVVVIHRVWDGLPQPLVQASGIRHLVETQPYRPLYRRGDGQHEGAVMRGERANEQCGRAAQVRQRHTTKTRLLSQSFDRQLDRTQQVTRLENILI